MKHVIAVVLTTLFLSLPGAAADKGVLRVLVGTYPLWLFTQNIVNGVNAVTVERMLPATLGCPHDYSLTPADARKIAEADVIVANGGGLDDFLVQGAARLNPDAKVIIASHGITGGDEQDGTEEMESQQQGGYRPNPHWFASPRSALFLVHGIADGLVKIDPSHADDYNRNAGEYANRLGALADRIDELVKTLPRRRVLAVHDGFDHLADDSGLMVVGVIESQPGAEPSATTMLSLLDAIRQQQVQAIFTEPQYPCRAAETLAAETGLPIAQIDPVANGPAEVALDYYERTMEANMQTLKNVLGGKN